MLQSKSAQEREAEKRLDILMKPALPGATKTTFGGLKRQKILNTHLQFGDLGIKKKTESCTPAGPAVTARDENHNKKENCTGLDDKASRRAEEPTRQNEKLEREETKLINLPNSLALVCDYNSSSENDSSN